MSEHVTKGHPIPALILLLVICVLTAFGIGVMNDGNTLGAAVPALIIFAFGTYVILVLGPDDDA